jgi:hypothetical protein
MGWYKICIADGHLPYFFQIGNFNLVAIILGPLAIFGVANASGLKLLSGIIPVDNREICFKYTYKWNNQNKENFYIRCNYNGHLLKFNTLPRKLIISQGN